ncbi:beta subunit of N-acylethanolamine-hydrolyzing acid amidase-domain-containing protein [Penicillium capsulatum]|uniref:ceramidase n=1 Tax=Penicillium capsulatum TaxID=69766 RepID=A0A9W9IS35_9EURO|nr:beta subunit of N-acylethanolamine-hydrolyzing acid amidase-domain-containing protein [Penicillium capsulatum]KAJ6130324.1 beta subunit of N-acylethanolamine-hydrolyzing acid amidase-domain-containing protein [Penicillium capsulatum]
MSGVPAPHPRVDTPPVFRINLSLPPVERYVELAQLYRDRLRAVRGLFDELVISIFPKILLGLIHWLLWLFLCTLYTTDETEEVRGISAVTGIDLYLLVFFNTVVDLLMGCTSGGARVRNFNGSIQMLHFRTLDWAMDPLRDLIVQLEFYRDTEPDKTLATSVTYVGFVGVLTAVRKDLSVSINFRPVHDKKHNFAFYFNHLLVLLGRGQSISSRLRDCILPSSENIPPPTLGDIVDNVPKMSTTAAYLIFCDGSTTVIMEKDFKTAVVRSSASFIVVTNHDYEPDAASPGTTAEKKSGNHIVLSLKHSLTELHEESTERWECMQGKWNHEVREMQRILQLKRNSAGEHLKHEEQREAEGSRTSLRQRRKREQRAKSEGITAAYPVDETALAITRREVVTWLTTYPIVNESTHYAIVMDPIRGKPIWVRRYNAMESK